MATESEILDWDIGVVTQRWSPYVVQFFAVTGKSRPCGFAEAEALEAELESWLQGRFSSVHEEIVIWDNANSEEFGSSFFALLDKDCCAW